MVAAAEESDLLKALATAGERYLKKVILVGDPDKIKTISKNDGIDISRMEIVAVSDQAAACEKAVALVRQGQADFIMKGSDRHLYFFESGDQQNRRFNGGVNFYPAS